MLLIWLIVRAYRGVACACGAIFLAVAVFIDGTGNAVMSVRPIHRAAAMYRLRVQLAVDLLISLIACAAGYVLRPHYAGVCVCVHSMWSPGQPVL